MKTEQASRHSLGWKKIRGGKVSPLCTGSKRFLTEHPVERVRLESTDCEQQQKLLYLPLRHLNCYFLFRCIKDKNFRLNTMQRHGGSDYLHRLIGLLQRNYEPRIVHALLWRCSYLSVYVPFLSILVKASFWSHSAFPGKGWPLMKQPAEDLQMHHSSSQLSSWDKVEEVGTRSGMITWITVTFIFYRNSTWTTLYHNNSSKMTEDTYGRKRPPHQYIEGMEGTCFASPKLYNQLEQTSILSSHLRPFHTLFFHRNLKPHKQVTTVRYAIAVFSSEVLLLSPLTIYRAPLSIMRLLAFLIALFTFCPGTFAFLFWWWIPLPIFVINGRNSKAIPLAIRRRITTTESETIA